MQLNIDETAWKRLDKLAKILNENPEAVIGKMACFWHESQAEMSSVCSRTELLVWTNLYAQTVEVQNKWIDAMLFLHFLEKSEDDFIIVGNQKHIEVYKKRIKASALGGERNKNRHNQINDTREAMWLGGRIAESEVLDSPVQFSSVQDSTEEIKPGSTTRLKTRRKRQEPVEFKNCEELKAALAADAELLDSWRKLYPDEEFRKRELIKAWDYYRINERKRPTVMSGWKRVIGSWLEKGWPGHAARIPSQGRPNAFAKNEPRPIRYPSSDEVFAEQERAREQAGTRLTPEQVKDMVANLAKKRSVE